MKTTKTMIIGAITLTASTAWASGNLNVYHWSDYVAEDTISNFEARTGITVNYDVFDSNEVLEAKMLTGASGYDVVVPSIEFLARQAQAGLYAKIDKSKLKNYGNLDPDILKIIEANDPDNTYGVPYMMFSVGVGYNIDMIAERISADKIGSWDMVFDPATASKLADCGVVVMDSPSEVMASALNYLGLDPHSEDKGDLEKASKLMLGVRPYIRYFHSSQYINDLANGDICLTVGYSGDILQARDRAAEAGQGTKVAYTIPKEGALIGFDMMAIPDDAPNPENALKFIDYILEPKVAADITNYVYFGNPNTAATEFVNEDVANDPGIYPPQDIKLKMFVSKPHTARYDRMLTRTWTTFKTGK
ncbi:polyamine ABC transporter substrate-binding protein [Marinobacter sp.]|uniref:polyamine ABC transporter substrate-binding protein n=1 Tax=Marinobacter sp. TaxID=50741 RepID=UPI003A93C647